MLMNAGFKLGAASRNVFVPAGSALP